MFLGSLFSKTACLKLATALLFALLLTITPVYAQEQQSAVPPQATCITPSGETIASYSNGTHGIVGDPNTFAGEDDVYSLGEAGALQCFCETSGNGVETIWWGSIGGFTQDQIESYTSSGWVYIPNGSLWGLEDKPYLAKNTRYLCSTASTGGEVSSSATNQSSPQILGASTLAATGGKGLLQALMFASAFLLIAGLLLKFRSAKN